MHRIEAFAEAVHERVEVTNQPVLEGELDLELVEPIVRHAAAYAIQIISEAVRQIPDEWLADYPTEPWAQIKGIGSRIRHEYFRLDDAILWQVVTLDSHALKTVMQAMLDRHASRKSDDG